MRFRKYNSVLLLTVLALGLLLELSSCASLLKGGKSTLIIESDSIQSQVFINDSLYGTTPITVFLSSRQDYLIYGIKNSNDTAITSQSVELTSKLRAGWIFLDILAGGFPLAIDAATKSWYGLKRGEVKLEYTDAIEDQENILPELAIDWSSYDLPYINFDRVLVTIDRGATVGASHVGKRETPYYWQTSFDFGTNEFDKLVNQELDEAQLNVVGVKVDLFDTKDDSWKAEYILGAKLTNIEYNDYVSLYASSKNYADCKLTIEWQLLHKKMNKVIYSLKTIGKSRGSGKKPQALVLDAAFKYGIRQLLNSDKFLLALTESTVVDGQDSVVSKPIILGEVEKIIFTSQSELIQRAIQSAVTIKAGNGGHGSGVFISTDGYILTNAHVIPSSENIRVVLSSGITMSGELVKINKDIDLAVIKIVGTGYKALPLGDSDKSMIGDNVIAIGTPSYEELAQTVTRGIISGIRTFDEHKIIQTDVSISPGNSGGPLINEKGEVIGIVTSKRIQKGVEGIGFCVPVNEGKRILLLK